MLAVQLGVFAAQGSGVYIAPLILATAVAAITQRRQHVAAWKQGGPTAPGERAPVEENDTGRVSRAQELLCLPSVQRVLLVHCYSSIAG